MTKADKCGNRTVRLDEIDQLVEGVILALLGESERLERDWDSGSDHSVELTAINDQLIDLTGLIGSDAYRAGTPQRAALDTRIGGLAARQADLAAETVKPAGWIWTPTGELFGSWWAHQDVTERNVWLRSMNVRVEFGPSGFQLDLGDIETLTQEMNASGSAAEWQRVFKMMTESGIAGVEVNGADVGADISDVRILAR